jgi:phosphoglycerol transferase
MFPTILDFIGFKVQGGKLGLGYTAFSKEMDLSLMPDDEEMNQDLLNQSDMYLDLWKHKSAL